MKKKNEPTPEEKAWAINRGLKAEIRKAKDRIKIAKAQINVIDELYGDNWPNIPSSDKSGSGNGL